MATVDFCITRLEVPAVLADQAWSPVSMSRPVRFSPLMSLTTTNFPANPATDPTGEFSASYCLLHIVCPEATSIRSTTPPASAHTRAPAVPPQLGGSPVSRARAVVGFSHTAQPLGRRAAAFSTAGLAVVGEA